MPFSLTSYLLGVGTVVGALAFGFGGGMILTKTALKSGPRPETRVERVARTEPLPPTAPQKADENANPAPPAAPPAATSVPQAPPRTASQVPANTAATAPTVNRSNESEPPKNAASPSPPTATAPPNTAASPPEQSTKSAEQPGSPAELKQTDRRKAASERKLARQKREAERKARDMAARAGQQQQYEPPPSARVFAFERRERRPSVFDLPLFGRPRGGPPLDDDDD